MGDKSGKHGECCHRFNIFKYVYPYIKMMEEQIICFLNQAIQYRRIKASMNITSSSTKLLFFISVVVCRRRIAKKIPNETADRPLFTLHRELTRQQSYRYFSTMFFFQTKLKPLSHWMWQLDIEINSLP